MSTTYVSVFGASQTQPGEVDYEMAVELGGMLAHRGHAVVNGGYGGLMEAVSKGAATAGGEVVGVTVPTVFPGRSAANDHITSERPAPDLVSRIGTMLDISDAAIALPGSIGTLAELILTWNVSFVARFSARPPIPLITVGEVWAELVPLIAERMSTDGGLVTCVDSAAAAVAVLDEQMPGNPKTPN